MSTIKKLALVSLLFTAPLAVPSANAGPTARFGRTAEPSVPSYGGSGSAVAGARLASVSITARSSCSHTVKIRYDDTIASLSSNEADSRSLDVGDRVSVLDDSERALASVTIEESTREVRVGSDCSSISAR
jgi:hypothetical protein